MQAWSDIDLQDFPPERELRLKGIERYSLFEIMFYRSNNWLHERRVSWLVEALIPVASKHLSFDGEKARTLALVHDDAEMITGDIQAGHKAQMSVEELAALDRGEEEAIEKLAETYPKEVNGYDYQELLRGALNKDSVEAQLVSYADKLDAHCESLHEVLAGNITLLTSVILYGRFFSQVADKLPLLKPFIEAGERPLGNVYIQSPAQGEQIRWSDYQAFAGKPHTKESVRIDTIRFPFYDAWKRIIIERGGDESMDWLTTQREFAPA